MSLRTIAVLLTLLAGCPGVVRAAATSAHANPDGTPARVELPSGPITYVDRGAGQPVVLVHGSFGDYRSWEDVAKSLAKGFRVIAYSRRGHFPDGALAATTANAPGAAGEASTHAGPPPKPRVFRVTENRPAKSKGDVSEAEKKSAAAATAAAVAPPPTTIEQDARDLDAFVQALGLGPVHLVGNGTGAEVCAVYARQHPKQVRSLVLCEPALTGLIAGTSEDSAFAAERHEVFARARFSLRDGFPDVALQAVINWEYGQEGIDDIKNEDFARLRDNLASLKAELATDERPVAFGCEDAAALDSPVLFVNGLKAPIIRRKVGEAFARCRPGTHLAQIKSAGHDVPRDTQGAFVNAVRSFLAATASGATEGLATDPSTH